MKRRNCKVCGEYSGKRKVCKKCKEEQPHKANFKGSGDKPFQRKMKK